MATGSALRHRQVSISPSRRAKGGCLPSPPWRSPRAPGYAALRVRCVARLGRGRQNSALRASNRLPSFSLPILCYSPA